MFPNCKLLISLNNCLLLFQKVVYHTGKGSTFWSSYLIWLICILSYSRQIKADEAIIRADLPITKFEHRVSNIYCLANPNAKEFKAHERVIQFLDVDAFTDCSNLEIINLSSNHLTLINKDTFGENLANLVTLDIANNRIDYLHHHSFSKLTKLRTLEVWDNFLNALHKDTFLNNINLEKLLLYGNHLEFIHEDTFINLVNLRVLHLDNNQLKILSPRIIRNQANLEKFFFFSNGLPDIDGPHMSRHLLKINEINFNNNDFSCPEMDRIYDIFSKRPGVQIETTVWSNPRRPDATNVTHDDLYCVPEDVWEKRLDYYRQRAIRAEILYDLRMSLDEQRDVIDNLKTSIQVLQIQFARETTLLKEAVTTTQRDVDNMKLQFSQLKLTNLELLNSKLKLEEEYRTLKHYVDDKYKFDGIAGTLNLNCKLDARSS